jgi:hypothetical protein
MNDAVEYSPDHPDSQGKVTYLLMAELAHGTPVLFGIKIRARDFESGLEELERHMNRNGGREFIEVEALQALVNVQLIQCPSCQSISPAASPRCVKCNMNLRSEEARKAIQTGNGKYIQFVENQPKALKDGTAGTHKLRPEHIVVYDVIPADSPTYRTWKETAELAAAQIRELRSKIQMPSPDDITALKMEELRRKQQGGQ